MADLARLEVDFPQSPRQHSRQFTAEYQQLDTDALPGASRESCEQDVHQAGPNTLQRCAKHSAVERSGSGIPALDDTQQEQPLLSNADVGMQNVEIGQSRPELKSHMPPTKTENRTSASMDIEGHGRRPSITALALQQGIGRFRKQQQLPPIHDREKHAPSTQQQQQLAGSMLDSLAMDKEQPPSRGQHQHNNEHASSELHAVFQQA